MVWSLLLTAGSEGPTLISCTASHLLSSVRSWHTVVCLSRERRSALPPGADTGVRETDTTFAIGWKGHYRIDGPAFDYSDRDTGQLTAILGYPTDKLSQIA